MQRIGTRYDMSACKKKKREELYAVSQDYRVWKRKEEGYQRESAGAVRCERMSEYNDH
jgi:hypothetical protein